MQSSHFDVIQCIMDEVADIDMPIDIHYDKDGYVSIQFNYGGLWFTLEHTCTWILCVYREYNDCTTENCVKFIELGFHISCIRSYHNGKMVIVGESDCYVFNPDGDDE